MDNPLAPTDEEVAALVQKGDLEQFGILVERFEAKMKRYAKKFLSGYDDGQDVVQDIFLKAYSHIQSFDSSRKFSSWLYRIAHNELINAIKKKSREPVWLFDYDTILPNLVSYDNMEEDIDRQRTQEILNHCLDKLEPKYREPLVLYYFQELGYQEISETMRIPISTVGVRLTRGKALLKDLYSKLNIHEQ